MISLRSWNYGRSASFHSRQQVGTILIEGENVGSMKVIERFGYVEFEGVKYFTKRINPGI